MFYSKTDKGLVLVAALLLTLSTGLIAADIDKSKGSEAQIESQEPTKKAGGSKVLEKPRKVTPKTKVATPERFIPTEDISEDLSVSFPVDI